MLTWWWAELPLKMTSTPSESVTWLWTCSMPFKTWRIRQQVTKCSSMNLTLLLTFDSFISGNHLRIRVGVHSGTGQYSRYSNTSSVQFLHKFPCYVWVIWVTGWCATLEFLRLLQLWPASWAWKCLATAFSVIPSTQVTPSTRPLCSFSEIQFLFRWKASRMESTSEAMRVHVSQTTRELLTPNYLISERGEIIVKGKGNMKTYWLNGKSDRQPSARSDRLSAVKVHSESSTNIRGYSPVILDDIKKSSQSNSPAHSCKSALSLSAGNFLAIRQRWTYFSNQVCRQFQVHYMTIQLLCSVSWEKWPVSHKCRCKVEFWVLAMQVSSVGFFPQIAASLATSSLAVEWAAVVKFKGNANYPSGRGSRCYSWKTVTLQSESGAVLKDMSG